MAARASPEVAKVARVVSDAIGDGCIVRVLDEAVGVLRAVAADHRDAAEAARLQDALHRANWALHGWGAHVVRTGRPVALAEAEARQLLDGALDGSDAIEGCVDDHGAAATLLVPLRVGGEVVGVVAALRDRGGVPYSLREQALLERVVARACAPSAVPPAARPDGGSDRFLRFVRDRPDLTAAELAHQLLVRADAAVWATDLDGRTLAVTPTMSELLALPIGRVEGLPMADFVDPLPMALVGAIPERAERADRRLRAADGRRLWVSTVSTPLVDGRGRRRGLLTTMHDITERKAAEVALRVQVEAAKGLVRVLAGQLDGQDPAKLRRWAADAAADVLGVRWAGIFELRPDGALLLRAGRGWAPGAVGRQRAATLGSPAALALTGAEPIVVPDVSILPSSAAAALGGAVRSGCWVGIGDGRGVLAALHDEPREFDRDERDFLASLARALAGCLGAETEATARAARDGGR